MVSNVTSSTFSQTYRDDFTDSDNYYRVLFNGGRALQARELTQLQTIIQREHEQHARFVFKEGASVHSGGVQVNSRFEFAKLNTTSYDLPTGYSSLIGETFTGLTSTIKVRIVDIVESENSDPATIYIEYVNNNSVAATNEPIRLTPGEVINGDVSGTNLQVQTTNTTVNPAVGRGTRLSVKDSTYFVSGHFVFVPAQNIIVSKYTSTPTKKVGFIVTEQIVTAQDDTALYDNSNDTPDLTAPGADRYQITLSLSLEEDVSANTTFIPSFDIIDGRIAGTKQAVDNSLSVIGDIMAKRTYEESGNYTVKPFILKTQDNDSDATKIDVTINSGLAYVKGYRYELFSPLKIPLDRPRTTTTVNNDVIAAEYGNYVICDNFVGMPAFDTMATINLRSATGYGGSTIGTARVRAVEKFGDSYRLYGFDVSMNSGQQFSSVRSAGTSSTQYADLVLENGVAVIKDAANNNLLFNLSNIRPSTMTDISLTTQRKLTGTTNGSGSIQFNLAASGETFANSSNWILTVDSSGAEQSISVTGGGNGTASVTIGSLPTSSAVSLAAYVNKGEATVKTKTLTNRTATLTPEGDNTVQLERADIYRINEIRDGSASGNDITNYYILNNGQRDNFYAEGVLYLKSSVSAPSGDVYVDYDYFEHGASGDFFAVNSYTGQIEYEDIPSYRQKNGETVQLRNAIDFRSRKANTADNFTGTGAVRMELPANTDLITADVSYYLGQAYRIVLDQDGQFRAIPGDRSLSPIYPSTPDNSMELYKLSLNPYTLDDSDVSLTYVDNRRYTMRDIGDLETRMDKIEEITTLNMMELETATLEVLDSNGNNRLKVGLTADNFSDHFQSARNDIEYRASTDTFNRELRPAFIARSSELVYDSANSSLVSLIGDTVYPQYTEVLYTSNSSASDAVPVNEFNLGVVVGNIKTSPSTDTWFDFHRVPPKILDGGVKIDPANGGLWNDWGFNWSGISVDVLKDNYSETVTKKQDRTTTNVTSKILKEEIVATSMGDKLLLETSIQYQRSRFVFFKVEGLRPNTRYFPFYDGVDVSDWVQSGAGSFQYFGNLAETSDFLDVGDKYKNATEYPSDLGGKTSSIFSDASGTIEGTFLIPNTDAIKFLTGTRQFVLIDISVLDRSAATSYAQTEFVSAGTMQQFQEELTHTRRFVVDTTIETITEPEPAPFPVTPNNPPQADQGDDDHDRHRDWTDANTGEWVGAGTAGGPKTTEHGKSYSKEYKDHINGTSSKTSGNSYGARDADMSVGHGGDDGGGGGGGKIVCTAMNEAYGFGSFRQKIWLAQSAGLSKEYQIGYHTLFGPLVKYAYKTKKPGYMVLRKTLEHIAKRRTLDIWLQKRGKRDMIGAVERAILEPLCYVTGWVIKKIGKH